MRVVPFVLHRHFAIRAGEHFDLRLKYSNKNKLASWALPKAVVPVTTKDRILAIQTPDHDPYWLKFKGEIPEGEYGAGTIQIEQSGSAEILGWGPNAITFIVTGRPMNGKYALIRVQSTRKFEKHWLLIKGKD